MPIFQLSAEDASRFYQRLASEIYTPDGLPYRYPRLVAHALDVEGCQRWAFDYFNARASGISEASAVALIRTRVAAASPDAPATDGAPPQPSWRPSAEMYARPLGCFLAVRDFTLPAFMWGGMDVSNRDALTEEYRALGVYTLPFGWKTRYPRFPQWASDLSPERYRETLLDVFQRRLVPLPMISIDEGDTLPQHMLRVAPYLHVLQELEVGAIGWGWEINDIGTPSAWTQTQGGQLDYIRALREAMPTALIFAHWTPTRWTIGAPGQPEIYQEFEGLQVARKAGLSGVLMQSAYDNPIAEARVEWLTYGPTAYGGNGGGWVGRIQKAGLSCVAFEHSRQMARWTSLRDAFAADGRVDGWC